MNRFFFILFIFLLSFESRAQTFGNEWVHYSQSYYKFPVVQEGIYRITYQGLLNAGIPIQSISSAQIQIFGKEQEIPLYVNDGGDNSIDAGDYVEFYAQKNKGWLDSLLYAQPQDIGNPGYSLFSDTLYYFLTWTNEVTKRFVEESATNFSTYTPTNFVLQKVVKSFSKQYYGGFSKYSSYNSSYSPGEGWGSFNFNGASNYTFTIPFSTPNIYNGIGAPEVLFEAKSDANSDADFTGAGNHHLRWEVGSNNKILYEDIFMGYHQSVVDTSFSVNELNNGTTKVYFKIIGDQGATTDYQSVNYVSLLYPRKTKSNQEFIHWKVVNSSSQPKSRIDMDNANLSSPVAYIIGGGIPRKIPFVKDNGLWKGLIPNSSNGMTQNLIIEEEAKIQEITNFTPVNGTGKFHDYSTENVESAYILLYNKKMQSSVNQYANYRKSFNGGSYNVVLCEVNDAWMQFGGGIPKHILGSKRAIHYIYSLASQKPLALFIAGKGVMESSSPNSGAGNCPRKNATVDALNLVPSYGSPASDFFITAGWTNSLDFTPAIPTGRIAANNNKELVEYLNKVKVYEAAQNQNSIYNKSTKEWQKQILHFGGGSTANEQSLLRSYLNGMKQIIEKPYFGGHVTSFFKHTSNPFNPVQISKVDEMLSNGVSLMTFFGHAYANGFDQSIDEPQNWGNTGKYPMIIGNGCYNGNIYKPTSTSFSERFVLIKDLGAIGCLSVSELGYASYLNVYTTELYEQISKVDYGGTIGEQVQNTIHQLELQNPGFLSEMTSTQMVLHADPVIRLNWHQKPEIDLTSSDIYFTPNKVSLATDSITVNIVLTNLGKSIVDTFSLTIKRNFPLSTIDSIYTLPIFGLNYKDTIHFNLPLQPSIGAGMNVFTIQADIPSFIPEQYDEFGNNQTTVNYFINIEGIMPVWPHNYAVVPRDSVVLSASTINPIAGFNTYRFEIDTTDLYNSPIKRYAIVSGLGGVKQVFPKEWKKASSATSFPLVLKDSVVYYWRVAIDSSVMNWTEYSFQYIPGKRGWGQSHFFQYKNNSFTGVKYDRAARKRNFKAQKVVISANVFDNPNSVSEYYSTLWKVNGQDAEYGIFTTAPSLHVGVVDPSTLAPWGTYFNGANPNHQFGNVNNGPACRPRVAYYFIFRQNTTAQLQAFSNMIENEIPDSSYVVIYTAVRALYSKWQALYPAIFNTFNSIGITGMSGTDAERAFIIIFQMGDPSSAQIIRAQQPGDYISLSSLFNGFGDSGVETSPIIGPSTHWKTLYWKQDPEETPSEDETELLLLCLTANKEIGKVIDTVFSHNDSIINLNNLIPANQYPFLQLQAKYHDSSDFTPAQIDRWHVLYEEVPEAAIDGSRGYVFLPNSSDSLQAGVNMTFAIDVKNISDLPMDSLLVYYWLNNENIGKHWIDYPRQDSLRVKQILRDTIHFSTIGMSGDNVLWMEVNPLVKGIHKKIPDQPELTHFNNMLQLPFHLGRDDLNPILDVTFDGRHILNGDIVNPNSEIVMTLKDDNPFLIMDQDTDTSHFAVYLTNPAGELRRIPFVNGQGKHVMRWIPATSSNRKFKIIYNAHFKESGIYKLTVQGADKSGNLSGNIKYRIQFKVILESSITHLMNYPNPFSTKTQFVFTLTGTQIPDRMKIQIMTVTGRIVREITKAELGPIRIGRNITDYAWDGRDEFGDPLANGVYLYHVVAKIDGKNIKQRASGADRYFKNNWGKMYLMR